MRPDRAGAGWQCRLLFRAVRFCARFLPALIVFNLVLVFTHWPALVDFSLRNELAHFLIHALIFVTALAVWMPVVSPLPEIPRLSPLPRMLFLFAQSIVPTIPASFLTFGSSPLYRFYEGARTSGAVDGRRSTIGRPDHEDRSSSSCSGW